MSTYLPKRGDVVTICGIPQFTYTVVGLRDWDPDEPWFSTFDLIRNDGKKSWDTIENLSLAN